MKTLEDFGLTETAQEYFQSNKLLRERMSKMPQENKETL